MRLASIGDLEPSDELAVIINVNTKLLTTLALVSALRHTRMPALLIDCESTDGSLEHFSAMLGSHTFHLLSAPLRPHGVTLDWLFAHVPAEKILLIDSDLEIHDPGIVTFFRQFIDDERVFGCGFIHGPAWITDHVGTLLEGAYYQERPWIPLVLLKVDPVREALRAGRTFRAYTIYNDFVPSYRLSRLIARVRSRVALFRRWRLRAPRLFRRAFYGHHPSVVYCDTGADVYQYLRYDRNMCFVGLPERFSARYATHFFGSTRNVVDKQSVHGGERHVTNRATARERLQRLYGLDVPD